MDNMVETYPHALTLDTPSGHRFTSVLPFHLCRNKEEILACNPLLTAPLEAEQAVANWTRMIRFFRAALPRADIVFPCGPWCLSGRVLDMTAAPPAPSLKSVIASVLEIDPARLDEASGVNLTENWDSLNQFMVMSTVEREFDAASYRTFAQSFLGRAG